ncbi:Hypp4286 [Branchiostoma lanceolatum]|uniref:Hypp4286 protein n=1 Tax=Branchiostoma lanceolatum TaxID=7740 RepID=A0A8K0F141_BRALA|nr:Hypp4286 [Branchiostoma lanceolatum]
MAAGRLLTALAIIGVLALKLSRVEGAPAPAKIDPVVRLQQDVSKLFKRVTEQEAVSKTMIGRLNLIQTDLKDIRRYMSQTQSSSPDQGSPKSPPSMAHASILSACIDDKVYRKGKTVVSINGVEYTSRLGNVNLVTFNQSTGQVMGHMAFDTARGEGEDMRLYLDKIPADSVVLIAIRDVGVNRLPAATDHKLIENLQLRLTNSTKPAKEGWIEKDESWAIESSGNPHVYHGVTYDAAKVLDGRAGTMWNPGGEGRYYNNWNIVFDFGDYYQISSIRLRNYGDWTHDATKFGFDASPQGDPYEWQEVVFGELEDTRNIVQQQFGGFSATSRFWRLVIKETGNGYQPWLCEVDFFGYQTPMMSSFASIVKKGSKTSWTVVDSNIITDGATVIETVIPLLG